MRDSTGDRMSLLTRSEDTASCWVDRSTSRRPARLAFRQGSIRVDLGGGRWSGELRRDLGFAGKATHSRYGQPDAETRREAEPRLEVEWGRCVPEHESSWERGDVARSNEREKLANCEHREPSTRSGHGAMQEWSPSSIREVLLTQVPGQIVGRTSIGFDLAERLTNSFVVGERFSRPQGEPAD